MDDARLFALRQPGPRGARGADGAEQVDVDALLPAFLAVAGPEAGGVVDEDVDPAECGGGFVHIGFDGCRIGHVADGCMHGRAVRGQLVVRGLQRVGATPADRHMHAFGGERVGDGQADTAAAAGDHGPSAGKKSVHDDRLLR